FRLTDLSAARAMPGAALVLSAAETAELGHLPCHVEIPNVKIAVPPYPILAQDEVRYVGDAIAFVVADTLQHARDAAEAVKVEWQSLPHVIGSAAAIEPSAPRVWQQLQSNLAFEMQIGDSQATAAAFAEADHVVSLTVINQRLVANYLDTRAVVAECDGGRLT